MLIDLRFLGGTVHTYVYDGREEASSVKGEHLTLLCVLVSSGVLLALIVKSYPM